MFLKSIKEIFGGKVYTYKRKRGIISIWQTNQKEFILYLRDKVNITHNKSLSLHVDTWFSSLSLQQKYAFLKGVFDGDGTIGKNAHNYPFLGICSGSKKFIRMVYDFFVKQFQLTTKVNSEIRKNRIYYIQVTGKQCFQFKDMLLVPCKLTLARKMKRILSMFKNEYSV